MRARSSPAQLLVTSSWSAKLPESYARIGISRGSPRGQRGYRVYGRLAPGAWFNSVDADEYRERYLAHLAMLDPAVVLRELTDLAAGKVPALLCFEKPPPDPAWCHRGLVSAWFADTLGLAIVEYGHEAAGWGWAHPKLPLEWRKGASETDTAGRAGNADVATRGPDAALQMRDSSACASRLSRATARRRSLASLVQLPCR